MFVEVVISSSVPADGSERIRLLDLPMTSLHGKDSKYMYVEAHYVQTLTGSSYHI